MHLRVLAAIASLALSSLALAEVKCPAVRLDEQHNGFRPVVGLGTKATYSVPACETIEVDVSEYVDGGVSLDGRPPSNYLYVQVQEGDTRVEITRELQKGERLVKVSPSKGKRVAGSAEIRAFAPGQGVLFAVGVKSPTNFNSYSMGSGKVGPN